MQGMAKVIHGVEREKCQDYGVPIFNRDTETSGVEDSGEYQERIVCVYNVMILHANYYVKLK